MELVQLHRKLHGSLDFRHDLFQLITCGEKVPKINPAHQFSFLHQNDNFPVNRQSHSEKHFHNEYWLRCLYSGLYNLKIKNIHGGLSALSVANCVGFCILHISPCAPLLLCYTVFHNTLCQFVSTYLLIRTTCFPRFPASDQSYILVSARLSHHVQCLRTKRRPSPAKQ